MKVRMIVGMSGTRGGQDWPGVGSTLDVDEAEARQLIAARIAVPVVEDRVETTTMPATDVETRDGAGLDGLRAQAERRGIRVDRRWGPDRLRQEIDKSGRGER